MPTDKRPLQPPPAAASRTGESRDNPGGFVSFFRSYMNGWIAAAVVLPTAITWKGMPIFESQRGILTTYTALMCILTLAFLFFSRYLFFATSRLRSRIGSIGLFLLPASLIGATVFCGYGYYKTLLNSAHYAGPLSMNEALKTLSMADIHEGTALLAYYILTVVFAEAALFFMAFREWKPSGR